MTSKPGLLRPVLAWLAAVTTPALLSASEPELVSVKKIWDAGRHNAFTDLIRFRGKFWCTFREADAHVGGDGGIRVIVSEDGSAWKAAAFVTEKAIDLRDPKLSVTPDGRLMLTMGGSDYGSEYETRPKLQGRQPRVAFSKDGKSWTAPKRVLNEGDWLWRVTWHGKTGYGVAYRTSPRKGEQASDWLTSLYRTTNGVDYELVTDFEIPGRPNETTLRFLQDDTMVALVRREGGNRHGWIGQSEPPYTDWTWHETQYRLGGPNFVVLPDGDLWAGSRYYPGGAKTVLAKMTVGEKPSYEPVLTLPSGGDTSYPGLLWHEGLLWMSYYASHEGKTSVYLARIRLPE